MDNVEIELKDPTGKKRYLSRTKAHPDAVASSKKTKATLAAFLATHTPSAPLSWQKVLATILGTREKLQQSNAEACALIAEKVFNNQWHITAPPPAAPALNGNKGAASGGQPAAMLGAQARDKSAEQESPEAAQTSGDETAVVSDEPAKTSEGASTGAAPADKTETRGCPISMVSGEELLQLADISLPGPMPFGWVRTYRSSHTRDIGLGCGWTHTGCEYLVLSSANVDYFDSEGRKVPFRRPQPGQRSKHLLESIDLDYTSNDSFELKQLGQWTKVFSRTGNSDVYRLTQLRHTAYKPAKGPSAAVGFAIHFRYNASNRLALIEGNWGQALRLERGSSGEITQLLQVNTYLRQERLLASFEYNETNDLIAVSDAAGQGERYRYANHLLQQRILPTGFSYYYEWDAQDTSAKCLRNWGDGDIYDYTFEWFPKDNHSRATDSRGYTTRFYYNDAGLIEKEIDPEGGVHRYEYSAGKKVAYTNPLNDTTHYFFTAHGLPAGERNALEQRKSTSWFQNKPTVFKDVDGTMRQRRYNSLGLLACDVSPSGQETHYRYNSQGLLTEVHNPYGEITKASWNAQGLLATLSLPQGLTRHFTYDPWGRLVSAQTQMGEAQNNSNQPAHDAPKSATRYHYDECDNLTATVYPDGQKDTYTYNNNRQLVKYSDRQGRVTQFNYDGLDQVTRRIDAQGESLYYQYDKERNLTALVNENGEYYRFEYDGCERLVKETGFDGREQTYQYNAAGQLVSHTDAGEVVTVFKRDALGRMLEKRAQYTRGYLKQNAQLASEPNLTKDAITRYAYDAKGRLKETYNQQQYIAFDYNVNGQVVKEHHSDLNEKMQRIKSSMRNTHFSYANQGNLTQIKTPTGEDITFGYHSTGGFASAKYNDADVATVEYDILGRETARLQGERITTTEYDPSGRLQKQHTINRQNKTHQPLSRQYGYNAFGNLDSLLENNTLTQYNYDLTGKLKHTQQKTGGQVEEEYFSFDPAGNLLATGEKKSRSTKAHTEGNRLKMQGDRKFTYDARGNITEEKRGKEGKLKKTFVYNADNQLVSVNNNGQSTHYTYDPLGRRITKQDDFGKTEFVWAGDQLIQETRKAKTTTYIFEPQTFKPLAQVIDNQIYHYHLDHLGTPKHLTDNQGGIVWQAQYKTYGNAALNQENKITNNLRFQGQYYDQETGLHYNRHRYYNPNTGQFTTQDPIGLLGGVNNYQYAPNPISWIDPLGLKCKEGCAYVYHYQGPASPHFAIVTENDGKKYGTEQWGGGTSKTLDIEFDPSDPQDMELVAVYKVKLPNAYEAMQYQKRLVRDGEGAYANANYDPKKLQTPDYNSETKSCLTHVFGVLNAGGKDAPETSPADRKTARYMMNLKKESATNDKG